MREKKALILLITIALFRFSAFASASHTFSGKVKDAETHEILSFATILLEGDIYHYSCSADENGHFKMPNLKEGRYNLSVSFVGYKTMKRSIKLNKNIYMSVNLHSNNQLNEVVITATESKGIVTASRIDRPAMQHLQPSSFTDLLELLPGGMSKDPDMGSANTMAMRETGIIKSDGTKGNVGNDYSITSLGTQFVVDGIPMNTDANLQTSPGSSSNSAEDRRNIVNRGVDMRSISTDDIESVEVVRGIPSAEYGNLTSGIINIKKIRKVTPLNARFKADGYSKLFSAGKGFAVPKYNNSVFNLDIGYFDAKPDPRNNLINYKRLNGSIRYTFDNEIIKYSAAVDYTGSFDNAKEDPELNYGNIDTYKSSYNRVALTNNFVWSLPKCDFVKGISLNTSVNAQFDRLERTKLISPQRYMIVPSTVTAGEHDATLLFKEYVADYLCDGKPFNAFAKLKADFGYSNDLLKHDLKAGAEWSYTKNFGQGQVYDLTRPLQAGGWSSRPRAYRDIPALQNLNFFAEELFRLKLGNHRFELMGGVRALALVGLDKRYTLNNKFYLDLRFNGIWKMPKIRIKGNDLEFAIGGGVGSTTKMPTLDYLFPDNYYNDIIQLGYYDAAKPEENSRFNIVSYVSDRTNYDLRPARNLKWELRGDISYAGNRLSINYFKEEMNSGFRYMATYTPYSYKQYDASQINGSTLTGPPVLEDIPYIMQKKLDGFSKAENGSRLVKEGVEFQFRSQRINPLRTIVNINGAWFRSTYTNSTRMMKSVSESVNSQALSDKYIGIYDWNDGNVYQQFNTNVMLDTQVPEWGLIFSTSFQFMWFTSKQTQYREGIPEAYLSAEDGLEHPYTQESMEDLYLKHLVIPLSPGMFDKYTVPMAFYINLKATKKIGKFLSLSMFANKLIDYTPSFESNGQIVRRNVNPYFGMELNFTL